VSAVASNDNLASKVISLALTKLVFGEHSRLDRVERYASTLPDYKKTKSGEIAGPIGKRIAILREAVTIGAAIRSTITNIDITSTFNLANLFGASPVLGGMLLPSTHQGRSPEKTLLWPRQGRKAWKGWNPRSAPRMPRKRKKSACNKSKKGRRKLPQK
jgi:hypothetical protein